MKINKIKKLIINNLTKKMFIYIDNKNKINIR